MPSCAAHSRAVSFLSDSTRCSTLVGLTARQSSWCCCCSSFFCSCCDEEGRVGVIHARESNERARDNLQQVLIPALCTMKSSAAGPPAVARTQVGARTRSGIGWGAPRAWPTSSLAFENSWVRAAARRKNDFDSDRRRQNATCWPAVGRDGRRRADRVCGRAWRLAVGARGGAAAPPPASLVL